MRAELKKKQKKTKAPSWLAISYYCLLKIAEINEVKIK